MSTLHLLLLASMTSLVFCQRRRADTTLPGNVTCGSYGAGELVRLLRANKDWLVTRSLHVRNCSLPRSWWAELRQSTQLRTLVLSNVRFEAGSIPADALASLRLERLIVTDSDLERMQPGALGQSEMEEIVLIGNEKLLLHNRMFSPVRKVGLLEIAGANVNAIAAGTFEEMSISELRLENNRLEEWPAAALQRVRELRVLSLRANLIRSVPSRCLLHATVVEVSLADCLLEEIAPDAFLDLPNLHTVDLSANLLEELPDALFLLNPSVNTLYLQDNQLSTLPSDLVNWSALKVIDLSINRWNCTCQLGMTLLNVPVAVNVTCDSPYYYKDQQLMQIHPDQCLERTTVPFTLPTGTVEDVNWLQQQTIRRRRLTTARRPRGWIPPSTTIPSSETFYTDDFLTSDSDSLLSTSAFDLGSLSTESTESSSTSSSTTLTSTVSSSSTQDVTDYYTVTSRRRFTPKRVTSVQKTSTSTSVLPVIVTSATENEETTSEYWWWWTTVPIDEDKSYLHPNGNNEQLPTYYQRVTTLLPGDGKVVDHGGLRGESVVAASGQMINPALLTFLIVLAVLLAVALLLAVLVLTSINIRKRLFNPYQRTN